MPRGIKTGAPAPDEQMLKRTKDIDSRVCIVPDKDEIKAYIHKRLEEGHLSVNRTAKEIGMRSVALHYALRKGNSVSIDLLSRLLWIVDGADCPYDIERGEGVR